MIKGGTAELLYVYTDVEPVSFNRGFYSVDMRFLLSGDVTGLHRHAAVH